MEKVENLGLCVHVQFSRESKSYPGSEADWERYMAEGGLATHTQLAAREHAGSCAACASLLALLQYIWVMKLGPASGNVYPEPAADRGK